VWFETNPNEIEPIGGRDYFSAWALKKFPNDEEVVKMASDWSLFKDTFHNGKDAP